MTKVAMGTCEGEGGAVFAFLRNAKYSKFLMRYTNIRNNYWDIEHREDHQDRVGTLNIGKITNKLGHGTRREGLG